MRDGCASPKVLKSMEVAPNIHDGLTRYIITPHGGKLMMGQPILISKTFNPCILSSEDDQPEVVIRSIPPNHTTDGMRNV